MKKCRCHHKSFRGKKCAPCSKLTAVAHYHVGDSTVRKIRSKVRSTR